MTIVDEEVEKSVYVGGIPYDTTEDSLRKTFSIYGHVITVKINNEGVGGKCYGFVTFTTPRSAVNAIKDMNGRTIGGRVVRVNEVKAKGERADTNREGFRRNFERNPPDRNRDREYAPYEDRHQIRKRDRSEDRSQDRERRIFRYGQARDHSLERNRERSKRRIMEEDDRKQEQGWDQYSNSNREVKRSTRHLNSRIDDKDEESNKLNGSRFSDQRTRDHSLDQDRERSERSSMEEDNGKQVHEWGRDRDLDQYRDREVNKSTRHLKNRIDDKDQESNKVNGSRFSDQRTRDHSSESWDNDYEVEEALKDANQELEELHKQVSQMEESIDEKQQLVSELQAESQNLEDALTAARKLSSQRRMQLVKLSRCYLQMKNFNEKLKSSEQELQSFVDTTTTYVDDGDDLRFDDDVSTYDRP